MAESVKKEIGVKIIVTVVSTLIVGGLAVIASFAPKVWKVIVGFCSWVVSAKIETPFWLLCLLVLAAGILVLVVLQKMGRSKVGEAIVGATLSWKDYVVDNFFGMKWRWRYTSSGQITDLWCYCPRDETCLVYKDDFITERSTMMMQPAIGLICETCGQNFGPIAGDKHSLCAKVERQIDRKLRSNEWQAAIPVAGGKA
ncbi:MAG: hypothetical protein WCK57_09715 [Verrucomicrobiae bacterium]